MLTYLTRTLTLYICHIHALHIHRLIDGVAALGEGRWADIRDDPRFGDRVSTVYVCS